MKKILVIVGMMFAFGGMAHASSSNNVAVLESSITVRLVSISSSVATDVSAGIEMADRTSLVMQNISALYDVNCSASAADLNAGHFFTLYAGGGSLTLNLRPYSAANNAPLKIFCKTTSTIGSSGITVIQAY